ncbi:hypothetical protein MIND_00275800 [Mycena indigotica]|uniref:Uncharacterized protein n=1 Tax=Mycena indigotica TaxID=2126181 RepID=A0A8H6WCA2_9AGAR|nr:uncharacterized protein MIND_00275800 [Mycena indigotica]KAF7312617.1 hypothetical protein MIND_00275800 [Mycena indigotica]
MSTSIPTSTSKNSGLAQRRKLDVDSVIEDVVGLVVERFPTLFPDVSVDWDAAQRKILMAIQDAYQHPTKSRPPAFKFTEASAVIEQLFDRDGQPQQMPMPVYIYPRSQDPRATTSNPAPTMHLTGASVTLAQILIESRIFDTCAQALKGCQGCGIWDKLRGHLYLKNEASTRTLIHPILTTAASIAQDIISSHPNVDQELQQREQLRGCASKVGAFPREFLSWVLLSDEYDIPT